MAINELKKTGSFIEHINRQSCHFFIIVPPGNDYFGNKFTSLLFSTIKKEGHSVAAFNFNCCKSKKEVSDDMQTEVSELWDVYKYVSREFPTKHIHLIGRSIGSTVLAKLVQKRNVAISSVSFFGYNPEEVCLENFNEEIFVIQSESERLHTIDRIKSRFSLQKVSLNCEEVLCAGRNFSCSKNQSNDHIVEAVNVLMNMYKIHLFNKIGTKQLYV